MWAKNRFLPAVFAALLAACAAGPDFVRPKPPSDAGYLPSAELPAAMTALGQQQQLNERQAIEQDWWRVFGNHNLDALVERALTDNPGVQGAQAALRQSQDDLRAGYGVFFPQADLALSAARQRQSPARFGLAGAGGIFNLFTLGATINYALDVFGGSRREVEALRASVDVQRDTLLATDLALSGNVINTAIAREAYAEQVAVTEGLVQRQREQLTITQTRADAGTVPYSAVASVRSALATTEASLANLAQRRDQADHALSLLLGQSTSLGVAPGFALDDLHLPTELPLSLPSSLVRQRPDILIAEAQLHQASAGIGVATAALLPTFSLSGSVGGEAPTFGSLDKAQNRFWSTGATADWPVFQGGTRWYQRKSAIDNYQRALAQYRQTVLAAFAQVADTLKALQHDAQALAAQDEASRAAHEALTLVQANYGAGLAGYLDVLAADEQYQQARLGYVQAQAQRYQDTVALYVALGGGWWNAPANGAAAAAGETPR